MQPKTCAVCGAKIEPGVAHCCAGPSYQFPTALEMLAELTRIRELLEAQAKPTTTPTGQTKAQRRETR